MLVAYVIVIFPCLCVYWECNSQERGNALHQLETSSLILLAKSYILYLTDKLIFPTTWVNKNVTVLSNCSLPMWAGGKGNGNPLQYSCLENPMDRGAWWAAVHKVMQSRIWLKRLSMHAWIGEGNANPAQYSCLENSRDSILLSTGSLRVRHNWSDLAAAMWAGES